MTIRQKVLEAAKRLIKSQPLENISISEIAKEAGVSRQSIYRHVGGTSELRDLLSKEFNITLNPNQDTRSLILMAASRTFAHYGYESTTLDQIASDANLTKGAIYWHFSSKNELFFCLLEERLKHQISNTPNAIKKIVGEGHPVEGLASFLVEQFSYAQSDPNWPRLFLEFVTHSREQQVQKQLSSAYQFLNKMITDFILQMQDEGYISSEINPSVLASLWTAMIDGLIIAWLLNPNQVDPKSWAPDLARILWNGISPK